MHIHLVFAINPFHPFDLFTDRNSDSPISMFLDFSITFLTLSYLAHVDFL